MANNKNKTKTKTKNLLLDAAIEVAITKGVKKVTLDATAKQANLSKGGILYHFPTRFSLIEGMLLRALGEFKSEVNNFIAINPNIENPTLHAVLRTYEVLMCLSEKYRVTLITALNEDSKILDHARKDFHALWLDIEKETSDPIGAYMIWTSIEGIHFFDLFGVNPIDIKQDNKYLERLYNMLNELPGRPQ